MTRTLASEVGAVSVADLVRDAIRYRGKRSLISGFLVSEPENRTLWHFAGVYGVNEAPCADVEVSDKLFGRRESLSRRRVVLSAVVHVSNSHEDGPSCDHVSLSHITDISYADDGEDPTVKARLTEGWFNVNAAATDADALRVLAGQLSDALKQTDRDVQAEALSRLVEAGEAGEVTSAARKESRVCSLLFEGSGSFANLLSGGSVDVIQEPADSASEGTRGALCVCTKVNCDPHKLSPLRVYFRAAMDPYRCLPVIKSDPRWFLDGQYLLGR